MYSTVIDSHPTVIRHQVPQPTAVGMQTDAAKAFAINRSDALADKNMESLAKGAYSIPVKIESRAMNDPTLNSYETPNFIHKKETVLNAGSNVQTEFIVDPEVYLRSKFQEDLSAVTAQFDKTKTEEEKFAVCNFYFYFYCFILFFNFQLFIFCTDKILFYFLNILIHEMLLC